MQVLATCKGEDGETRDGVKQYSTVVVKACTGTPEVIQEVHCYHSNYDLLITWLGLQYNSNNCFQIPGKPGQIGAESAAVCKSVGPCQNQSRADLKRNTKQLFLSVFCPLHSCLHTKGYEFKRTSHELVISLNA